MNIYKYLYERINICTKKNYIILYIYIYIYIYLPAGHGVCVLDPKGQKCPI